MCLSRLWFTALSCCVLWTAFGAGSARAYTISSVISDGCHESITAEALRTVRAELPSAAPLPTHRNDKALIDDLPFSVPKDLQDIAGATLLVAVRDNDLKGRHTTDLSGLAQIHGNPGGQREHCLRGPEDKGPGGSESALAACRAFIRERAEQALAGLTQDGAPDPQNRTELKVYLALRHEVDASLPTYYVRIGQAIHALEDSFTHDYRSPDGMKVTVVGNWLEQVEKDLDEAEEGPGHRGELDECKQLDELRTRRRELATQAAADLLRATLDPALTADQRLARVDTVLERYLSFQPGCTHENRWCDAEENEYGDSKLVKCSLGSGVSGALPLLALGLLVLLRRRVLVAALVLLSLGGAVAHADDKPARKPRQEAQEGENHTIGGSADAEGNELLFGGYAGAAGSVDHGGLAFQLAARMRFRKNWIFGAGAEWNPFISDPRIYDTDNFKPGVLNGHLTAIFRLPLAREQFNLRITADLGFSTILMDLYGVPRGSTGIYAALSPLGLEWKMATIPYLIINPLSIALPAPHLSGVPYVYAQYRFTVGIELYQRR